MFLHALATAVPDATFTQQQCWDVGRDAPALQRLNRRSQLVLRAILNGDSGIATRHFALGDFARSQELTEDELNAAFRREAPRLAGDALVRAMQQAAVRPPRSTRCSSAPAPAISAQGSPATWPNSSDCGAMPSSRTLSAWAAARRSRRCAPRAPIWPPAPGATVAAVAVEICSAAFYLDDDLGVLISACLFGDGAAAAIWRCQPGPTGLRCEGFRSLHRPDEARHAALRDPQGQAAQSARSLGAGGGRLGGGRAVRRRAPAGARSRAGPPGRPRRARCDRPSVLPGYPLDASHAVPGGKRQHEQPIRPLCAGGASSDAPSDRRRSLAGQFRRGFQRPLLPADARAVGTLPAPSPRKTMLATPETGRL